MDNERTIIAILILIVCCLIGGLIYTVSLSSEPVNNTTLNNTANITNNTTNDTADVCQVSDEHESSSSVSSQSKDPHSDGFVKVIHGTVSRIVMEKVMFYMIKHLEDL